MAEKGKGYTIGVSSGMFGIAQGKEKEEYINVLKKVFWSSTKGVSFSQLDLESITEFIEPELKENVEKIKSLGIRLGIHGETAATTGIHTMPLDSALSEDYIRAHERLMEHIKGGNILKAEYVLTHASESTPFILLGREEFQPAKMVDFWGRPLNELINEKSKEGEEIRKWILKADPLWEDFLHEKPDKVKRDILNEKMQNYRYAHEWKEPSKEEMEKMEKDSEESALNLFVRHTHSSQLMYGPERPAYYIIAKWMQITNDPLWQSIVARKISDEELFDIRKSQAWVPAVACKYIWGHFSPKDRKFEDPKVLLEKYGIDWIFETEMAKGGYETYMRVARIPHLCALASAIKSNKIGVAIDYQHLLSCNLNPLDEIDAIPAKNGGIIKVIHLSYPTPHVPSHIGIPLGSEAQLFIYKGLYALRKKGFYNGIIIFERGDPESVQQSVLTIRLIVQFLEKDVEPDKLPEEFYGMKPGGPEIARQLVAIREHALDPLKGLLTVPEEEHGFFGKAAIEKGKGEEWKKEKYK